MAWCDIGSGISILAVLDGPERMPVEDEARLKDAILDAFHATLVAPEPRENYEAAIRKTTSAGATTVSHGYLSPTGELWRKHHNDPKAVWGNSVAWWTDGSDIVFSLSWVTYDQIASSTAQRPVTELPKNRRF